MKKVIYLHGFASTGNSAKAQALRDELGSENVLAPDLPIDPREVRALVDGLIRDNAEQGVVLVGTSLGGFYAWYFSQRWDVPCVLVNPSTRPSTTVGQRIGTHTNYATGAEFEITPYFATVWSEMEAEAKAEQNGSLISLFVARDDDVIPWHVAAEDIPHTAMQYAAQTGGHRFEKEWDLVTYEAKLLARN